MRRLLAGVLAGLLLAGCGSDPAPPVVPTSSPGLTFRTYPVADGVRVHAWTRPGRSGAPWAVYVHGGSWYAGRGNSPRADQWARHEVPRGYQVFGLDYRLTDQAQWPAQREDVAAGVDWIRAHTGRFGLDPARGVVIGESAGGHLAAIEASRGGWAGSIDLAGVVDPRAALTAPDADLGRAAVKLVGCTVRTCPARWRDTRAISHVGPRTPPLLIVHAVNDPVVPSSMSRSYTADLRAAGKTVTLRIVRGRNHALMLIPSVLRVIDRFLDASVR